MKNAKKELMEMVVGTAILAAEIEIRIGGDAGLKSVVLYPNSSPTESEAFWDALDFQYDAGYGREYLFGTVWMTDGAWMDRETYDGMEWWDLHIRPELPTR
jgi:hypothetical protein